MLEVVGSSLNLVLTVNAQGQIGTYPIGADTGERELFVLTPTGKSSARSFPVSHLETAVLNKGGEHHCVTAVTDGGKAATVGCDTRAEGQDLQVVPADKDASGWPAFRLMLGGQAVEVDRDGQVRTEIVGDNLPQTRFVFVDAGKAPARAGN
jgi:hypothetical protein